MIQKYDDATKKFMEESSATAAATNPTRQVIKSTARLLKAVNSPTPGMSVSRAILKTGIGALAAKQLRSENEKTSAEDDAHDVHVLDVYEKLNDKYSSSWWEWEPETVHQTLDHDFGISLGEDGVNIVGALQVILNTNLAHEQWHVFEKVGHAFNTNIVDFTILQPLDVDEVALTVAILNKIRPNTTYEDEVCTYMAATAKNNGVVYLPEEFFPKCAQDKLDEMNNDILLKEKVHNLWSAGKRTHDDPLLQVQLESLKEVEGYLEPHGISSIKKALE